MSPQANPPNPDPPSAPAGTPTPRAHKRAKIGHILFLIVAVAATIGLAWWQWTRFRSGSGTFQNLGYALQWPMFGAFFVIAYRKYLEYENDLIDQENEELAAAGAADTDGDDSREIAPKRRSPRSREPDYTDVIEDFLPKRPQLDVDSFNALNVQRRGRDQHEST